jgi:hypothetical protein
MENEETHRLGILGYDERSETWYIQPPESHRLALTRQSLARLVQLYNSIHKGNALALVEQRELRRMEESRQRHSDALRDLYLHLNRRERRRPLALLRRVLRALVPPGGRREG